MKFNPLKTRKGRLEKKILLELKTPSPNITNILNAVDDYEEDNLQTIAKLKKVRGNDTKKISGAIRQCIEAHGPITKQYIGSLTKRVYGSLLQPKPKLSARQTYSTIIEILFYLLVIYQLIKTLI